MTVKGRTTRLPWFVWFVGEEDARVAWVRPLREGALRHSPANATATKWQCLPVRVPMPHRPHERHLQRT